MYVQLVKRASFLWRELEADSGENLLTKTGGLDYGNVRNPHHLAQILEEEGISHELVSKSEAMSRWPQFVFDTDVLWQPEAAAIDAESAVKSMVDLAVKYGAGFRTGWKVQQISRTATGFLVQNRAGEVIEAERLVVAAGGWLPEILDNPTLPRHFVQSLPQVQVRQGQIYHFPYAAGMKEWPSFVHKNEAIQTYGLQGGRDADFRGLKVAEFNVGKVFPSASHQDGLIDPEDRQRIVDYVVKHLPGVAPEPYAETTCIFTNTQNEDFILERFQNLTIASPCSGHGAKFAPLIGDLVATLSTAPDEDSGRAAVPEAFLASRTGAAAL